MHWLLQYSIHNGTKERRGIKVDKDWLVFFLLIIHFFLLFLNVQKLILKVVEGVNRNEYVRHLPKSNCTFFKPISSWIRIQTDKIWSVLLTWLACQNEWLKFGFRTWGRGIRNTSPLPTITTIPTTTITAAAASRLSSSSRIAQPNPADAASIQVGIDERAIPLSIRFFYVRVLLRMGLLHFSHRHLLYICTVSSTVFYVLLRFFFFFFWKPIDIYSIVWMSRTWIALRGDVGLSTYSAPGDPERVLLRCCSRRGGFLIRFSLSLSLFCLSRPLKWKSFHQSICSVEYKQLFLRDKSINWDSTTSE